MAMPVGFIPRRVMQMELLQIQPCSMHTTLFVCDGSPCQADSMMVIPLFDGGNMATHLSAFSPHLNQIQFLKCQLCVKPIHTFRQSCHTSRHGGQGRITIYLLRVVLLLAVRAEPGVSSRQHILQLQAVAHQQARPAEAPLC